MNPALFYLSPEAVQALDDQDLHGKTVSFRFCGVNPESPADTGIECFEGVGTLIINRSYQGTYAVVECKMPHTENAPSYSWKAPLDPYKVWFGVPALSAGEFRMTPELLPHVHARFHSGYSQSHGDALISSSLLQLEQAYIKDRTAV